MKWVWVLGLLLLAACVATSESDTPPPMPTTTQLTDVTEADIQYDQATETYSIPDRGDGCTYQEVAHNPAQGTAPETFILRAAGCPKGVAYMPTMPEGQRTGYVSAPAPTVTP